MPRANRYFIPGHIWHLTHRCHQREFLLKFSRDRRRWRYWLYEAKKRFGLSVLNYIVTSNHVHLLVRDVDGKSIPPSMQLIAGRMGQEYNCRKGRRGAFWEDRYHATAIETGDHLARCMVYIDLNMVRAGAVNHPADWFDSGYRELQDPPARYGIIDFPMLLSLLSFKSVSDFQERYRELIEVELRKNVLIRQEYWSRSLAVGSEVFVKGLKKALGVKARSRKVVSDDDVYSVREALALYETSFCEKNSCLRAD
jgi:putative transposase